MGVEFCMTIHKNRKDGLIIILRNKLGCVRQRVDILVGFLLVFFFFYPPVFRTNGNSELLARSSVVPTGPDLLYILDFYGYRNPERTRSDIDDYLRPTAGEGLTN